MSQEELATRIVGFAHHCGDAALGPERAARLRGWLDPHGMPTEDGRALIRALRDQDATRSVFRGAAI
jgi:hypothetical protein